MKLFVIHRFKDRGCAKNTLKSIAQNNSLRIDPVYLDSIGNTQWKQKAESAISQAEAVIVYNKASCEESDNAKWEIELAKNAQKEILFIDKDNDNSSSISKLISLYELQDEFDNCFSTGKNNVFELYKMIVESSESLIQRRQKTNAFFITVIGSLLAIAGLLIKSGAITVETLWVLYGFSIVGLLLCNSWRNLIDNYGKLNKAKFDVILRLEKELDAQIFMAEWVALGKGLRPTKYQSFTSTEKNVPLYFAILIVTLTWIAALWQIFYN